MREADQRRSLNPEIDQRVVSSVPATILFTQSSFSPYPVRSFSLHICSKVYTTPGSILCPQFPCILKSHRLLLVVLRYTNESAIGTIDEFLNLRLDDRNDNDDEQNTDSNTNNDSHSHIFPPVLSAFIMNMVGTRNIPHLLTDTVCPASETLG